MPTLDWYHDGTPCPPRIHGWFAVIEADSESGPWHVEGIFASKASAETLARVSKRSLRRIVELRFRLSGDNQKIKITSLRGVAVFLVGALRYARENGLNESLLSELGTLSEEEQWQLMTIGMGELEGGGQCDTRPPARPLEEGIGFGVGVFMGICTTYGFFALEAL